MNRIIRFIAAAGFGFILSAQGEVLTVYCGAGLRPPMQEAAEIFKAKHGVQVQYMFGGSAQLLAQIELTQEGDLFLPGEEYYINLASQRNLLGDTRAVLAYWVPVILTWKNNPKTIVTLEDLCRNGVTVGIGDERLCAIGVVTDRLLKQKGLKDRIRQNIILRAATVNDLGNAVKLKSIDAAIVWDATAEFYRDSTEAVPIPGSDNELSRIVIALLRCSKNRLNALLFVDYLNGPEGRSLFKKYKYKVPVQPGEK